MVQQDIRTHHIQVFVRDTKIVRTLCRRTREQSMTLGGGLFVLFCFFIFIFYTNYYYYYNFIYSNSATNPTQCFV